MSANSAAGKLKLTEDEIDDVLFFARAGQADELKETLEELSKKHADAGKESSGTILNGGDTTASVESSILLAAVSESGNSALHYCSANGHQEVLQLLLPYATSESLLQQNASGNTPLHWAALNGHLDTVKALVEAIEKHTESTPKGTQAGSERIANGTAKTQDDAAALASETADLRITEADVQRQVNGHTSSTASDAPAPPAWDIRNAAGRGPMSEAQMNGREEVVTWLLERMVVGSNQQQQQEQQEEVAEEEGREEKQADAAPAPSS